MKSNKCVFSLSYFCLIVVFTFVFFGFAPQINAQDKTDGVFKEIAEPSRSLLVKRLELFYKYGVENKRDKMYEMMFGEILFLGKKRFVEIFETAQKEKIAKGQEEIKFISFTPTSIDKKDIDKALGAQWRIVGKTKRQIGDKITTTEDYVFTQQRGSEWYFAFPILMVMETTTIQLSSKDSKVQK